MKFEKCDSIIVVDPLGESPTLEFEIFYIGEMKFMGRNDKCFCGSGKKMKHCHADVNEKSLVAKMLELYAEIDKRNANAHTICEKGCGECCKDDFIVYFSEYLTILHHICTPEMVKGRIVESFREVIAKKDKTNGFCVFLDQKDQSCKIYAVRPALCRNFGYILQDTLHANGSLLCEPMSKSSVNLPLGLIDEEKYDKIDKETYRITLPYKINGKKIPMGGFKPSLTAWLHNVNSDGYIDDIKVKTLLEKATNADINEFIRELFRK